MNENMSDDVLVALWKQAQAARQSAIDAEMFLRKRVTTRFFPNPTKGTQRADLPTGQKLKLVHNIGYKLAENEAVEKALDAIEATGVDGAKLIADRLVKWKPELSVSEYNKLPPDFKTIIDSVITTSDRSPDLEIEEPKGK